SVLTRDRLVDTLLLARRKFPGGSNRLDDLCGRYGIDNSRRTKHGALLDAELLAEVYLELVEGRQAQLGLAVVAAAATGPVAAAAKLRPTPLARAVSALERAAHRAFIATLGGNVIWRDYLDPPDAEAGNAAPSGCTWRRRRLLRIFLPVQTDEADRIEQQRRETAVDDSARNDLARERKQQPRAFDHDHRSDLLLRDVLQPEHAGIDQLEVEQNRTADLGL